MALKFHKMHGAGNDFVLLDLRDQEFLPDAEKVRALANRNTGIGCDQVLVLQPASHPSCLVDFEVWNADGRSDGWVLAIQNITPSEQEALSWDV